MRHTPGHAPGAADAAKFAIGFAGGKKTDETDAAIKKMFTPEFRNRLDAVIPFGHLPEDVIAQVVEKFVLQLEAQLADRHVTIELTPEANSWLAERGYDEQMGARPLARVIQENIKKPLAEEILFGQLKKGGVVKVDVDAADTERLDFEIIPGDRLNDAKPKRKSKKF